MRLMFGLVAAAALGGCAANVDAPLSPAFGMALARMDTQIIDPRPATGPREQPGRAAELALRRYQEHRIIEPIGASSGPWDDKIFQRSGAADDAAANSRTPSGKADSAASSSAQDDGGASLLAGGGGSAGDKK